MKPKVKLAAARDYRADGATHETRITPYGRTCNCCGTYKKWELFYPSRQSYTKHLAVCKVCHNKKIIDRRKRKVKIDKSFDTKLVNQFLLGK